jgi:hypothetical protein
MHPVGCPAYAPVLTSGRARGHGKAGVEVRTLWACNRRPQVGGGVANQGQPIDGQSKTLPACYTDCPPMIAYDARAMPREGHSMQSRTIQTHCSQRTTEVPQHPWSRLATEERGLHTCRRSSRAIPAMCGVCSPARRCAHLDTNVSRRGESHLTWRYAGWPGSGAVKRLTTILQSAQHPLTKG